MESAAYALGGAVVGVIGVAVLFYYVDYVPGLGALINRAMRD